MTTNANRQPRLFALDALRVFAIVMMLAYHFIYDLKYFGYVDCNTPLGQGFRYWRTAIVFGFILVMGLSMVIASVFTFALIGRPGITLIIGIAIL